MHTNLERSESEPVSVPFAIDQAFLRVPYNLSVFHRGSGCRAIHVFSIYCPAAFHGFVDRDSDLQVARGSEVESWLNFHDDGEALARDGFDVGGFGFAVARIGILLGFVLVVWLFVVMADYCDFDTFVLHHVWREVTALAVGL